MAIFNFKVTEDDTPGGGVYKIPGGGTTWTIKQSDYPNVNLSSMSDKNFFLATTCNSSGKAKVKATTYQNVEIDYDGGNAGRVAYSYANGIGTVSVIGIVNRSVNIKRYLGDYSDDKATATFSYALYMSRTPIV